jgi:hypothetical protein
MLGRPFGRRNFCQGGFSPFEKMQFLPTNESVGVLPTDSPLHKQFRHRHPPPSQDEQRELRHVSFACLEFHFVRDSDFLLVYV